MRRRKFNRLLLLPILAGAIIAANCALSSCNDIGCTDLRSSIPLAGFYSSSTGSQVTVDSLQIGGVGAPHDSLLVNTGDRTSSLYLPFRSEKGSTSFFIKYASKNLAFFQLADTITFDYTSTAYFASADCGLMFNYDIKGVRYTRHIIDSIAITDSLVTNQDMERIKVFFRTSSESAN